jgi:hypothetical protein
MQGYFLKLMDTRCVNCNKKIKKAFIPYGTSDTYGSECIKDVLPIPIEVLEVPAWLLEICEQYITFREKEGVDTIEDADDFSVNFFNIDFGVDMVLVSPSGLQLVDNGKAIKISGKRVKAEWVRAIFDYLIQRREELNN